MANEQNPDEPTPETPTVDSSSSEDEELEIQVAAYDLDDDGKISLIEQERARLGLVDARLEEIAEGDGVVARIADAAHKVVDQLDND